MDGRMGRWFVEEEEKRRDAKRDNHQGISAAFDSWETQTSILTGRKKWEAGNKEGSSSIHRIDDTQGYTVCAYLTVSLAAMGVTTSFPTGFRLHRYLQQRYLLGSNGINEWS